MPQPPPYQYAEGGGSNPPYGEDFFQRIVGVHWGEGRQQVGQAVFVFAESNSNVLYYVKFKSNADKSPIFRTIDLLEEAPFLPSDQRGPTTEISGSSFAVVGDIKTLTDHAPAFVLCGNSSVPKQIDDGVGNLITVNQSSAWIYHSSDGLIWSKVHNETYDITSLHDVGGINDGAVVWDPAAKSFYRFYNVHSTSGSGPSAQAHIIHTILASANGHSWSKILEQDIIDNPDFRSPFELEHCAHNNCVDEFFHHVPDGVIWQDTKDVARPTKPPVVDYYQGYVNFTPGESTVEIVQSGPGGIANTSIIPNVTCVTCVAGVNGVLMAGGYGGAGTDQTYDPGAVAYSLDGGKTWRSLTATRVGVTTMAAASF